jgi:hypothetical protein
MITRQKAALSSAAGSLLLFAILLGSCATGEYNQSIPNEIRKVEIIGNEINISAARSLAPGAFVLSSPPRLVLTADNTAVLQGIPVKGELPEGMIKDWELSQGVSEKSADRGTRPAYSARLTASLRQNVTYQITSGNSGCKVVLSEIKTVEEKPTAAQIEIPKELYPRIQKMNIGPGGAPIGTVAMVGPEDEKAARDMLKEILPKSAVVEKLPPAKTLNNITYRTKDGNTFEVVIGGDGEFGNYEVSTLDKPVRIVLDIYNVKSVLPKNVFQVNTGKVRQVRIGKYPDKTRVVVELSGPIKDARIVNVKSSIVIQIIY